MSASRGPQLIMVNPPETKIRFRYLSEKGSHGGLTAQDKSKGKKSYPTVKLINYRGKKCVYVRVSLFTEDKKEHVLEFKEKKADKAVPNMIEYIKEDGTAVFPDLKILSKKKHEIEKLLVDRKIKNVKDGIPSSVRADLEKKYSKEVKERAKAILNSVRLKFEAFEEDKPNVALCSLFSEIICNQKAASKGDLKIYRMSSVAGSCAGGDEVILLCDKVQKENIKVRFYEMDDEEVTWEGYGVFSRADVHFQVAITFKTPPYKDNVEKTVYVCLERNMNDSLEMSEARKFTYKPEEIHIPRKRKYQDSYAQPKEDEIMPQEEILQSSPMDVYSDSSSHDSTSNRGNIWASQNVNLLSGVEPESASSSEVSNNSRNMSENENIFKDFGFNHQEWSVLLDDNDFNLFETELFPDLIPSEQVDGNFQYEQIQNHCLQTVQMDFAMPVGEMGISSFDITSIKSRTFELFQKGLQNDEIIRKCLSARDSSGNTVLHAAVRANKKIANIIASANITNCNIINEQNYQKQTALHLATKFNNEKAVKFLLKNGADPNLKDIDGNNCYHLASYHDYYIPCIFSYQSIRPNVNAFNYEGFTPLHIAVMKNSLNFHLLRTHGADMSLVDQKCCKSLLHFAVEYQPSFVPILLDMKEIDVNVQDCEGNTPLHIACANDNINVVKQLLQAGADPSLKNYKEKSKEDTTDELLQMTLQSYTTHVASNSENEDTSDGETPKDMTSNIQILEMLEIAAEAKVVNSSDNVPSPSELSDNETFKVLCAHLDDGDKWKKIATFFIDEKYIGSLGCSESPTKALLTYIKKEHPDSYLVQLKEGLSIYGLTEAVKIVEELF